MKFDEVIDKDLGEAIAVAEDYFQMPPETCSMVKATVGEWYLRKNSSIKRIFGSAVACEPFNLAWEIMKKEGYNFDLRHWIQKMKGVFYDDGISYPRQSELGGGL